MSAVGRRCHRVAVSGDTVRVLQLTDTHLCRESGGSLLGMDTDHSLQAVISLARSQQPRIDALLGTGDMSNHGYLEAYQRLRRYFDQLCPAQFWLPGNHDDRSKMEQVDTDGTLLSNDIRLGRWQLVMLDSQVPGKVGGRLGQGQLQLLREALDEAAREQLFSLVCLHHQPVAIGCRWLDEQMVADADELFAVLADYPGVRGVLWGHIHQQVDRDWGGRKLMASPSTCVQFAPGSDEFRADAAAPGYRWLELRANGEIESGVSRVEGVSFQVDLDSHGYL
ncbi:3',5'-cyclic-AMP phosphodiesterase [Haliea sp. E1-2-M8]|uniref:3',5'-cyclic-AMP phosphodiesterase n=1 Tax=Haliea sp. E1-2-M8 TaxID=3064706 RepID=UPI00271DE147|nr:3',5'-cyclic-AMP phosphodiesterase [Haliea sp. E1-2-M8]MDO8862765.1 3',5'-cyclic-AMP phosphodiesterase [Haliea sp. E1-2-M8]